MATKKEKALRVRVIERMTVLVTTAFGLVAALAWNEAIKSLFSQIFGVSDQISALFTYAILVTVIAVLITVWLSQISEKINGK
jgi:hypothetical protein